jgi:hypothetical protein
MVFAGEGRHRPYLRALDCLSFRPISHSHSIVPGGFEVMS